MTVEFGITIWSMYSIRHLRSIGLDVLLLAPALDDLVILLTASERFRTNVEPFRRNRWIFHQKPASMSGHHNKT